MMSESFLDKNVQVLKELKSFLSMIFIPKLNSGHFLRDLYALVLLITYQDFIIDLNSAGRFLFDIVTPWVLVLFVLNRSPATYFLVAIASFLLEIQSTIPAGTIFCIYFGCGMLIELIIDQLSWTQILSWLILFAIGALCYALIEILVLNALESNKIIEGSYYLSLLVRSVSIFSCGLLLSKRHMTLTGGSTR